MTGPLERLTGGRLAALIGGNATLRIAGGLRLGYAEFGHPEGAPILFFHGIPGSRLLGRTLHEQGRECGARIIALERPGFGLSEYRPVPTVLDWGQLACSAADALGLERFSVLGVSGGGPYALACGRITPERVGAVGIVSSLGSPEALGVLNRSSRLLVALGRISPRLAAPPIVLARRRLDRHIDRALAELESLLAAEGVDHPGAAALLLADLLEAFSSGCRGVAGDCARVSRWWFKPEEVQVRVHLWHGCDDRNVSIAAAERLAERLPDCDARFLSGAGHFGVIPRHSEEILSTLVESVPA